MLSCVQDRGAAACSGTDPGLMALQALLMSLPAARHGCFRLWRWVVVVVMPCDAASGTFRVTSAICTHFDASDAGCRAAWLAACWRACQ